MLSCFNVTITLGLTITEKEEEANIKRQIVLCLREAGGRREGHFRNIWKLCLAKPGRRASPLTVVLGRSGPVREQHRPERRLQR